MDTQCVFCVSFVRLDESVRVCVSSQTALSCMMLQPEAAGAAELSGHVHLTFIAQFSSWLPSFSPLPSNNVLQTEEEEARAGDLDAM